MTRGHPDSESAARSLLIVGVGDVNYGDDGANVNLTHHLLRRSASSEGEVPEALELAIAGANEGKLMMIVPSDQADAALGAMKAHRFGREAAIIGDIVKKPEGIALVETAYGSRLVTEMPIEEQLPRSC